MTDQIEETIRKFALQNAVFFKGTANPKAVVESTPPLLSTIAFICLLPFFCDCCLLYSLILRASLLIRKE